MLVQLYAVHCLSILSALPLCCSALAYREPHDIYARGIQEVNIASRGIRPTNSGVKSSNSNHNAQVLDGRHPAENLQAVRPAGPHAPHLFSPAGSAHIKNIYPITNSDPSVARHPHGRDINLLSQEGVPHLQPDSNGSSEPGKTLNAPLTRNGMPTIGVAVDNGSSVHLQGENVQTIQKPPVAAVADRGLHSQDLEKPNALKQRGPAPMPPATDPAPHPQSPEHPETRAGITVQETQPTDDHKALQAVVRHYQLSYDKAKCSIPPIHNCMAELEKSKNIHDDARKAYMRAQSVGSLAAQVNLRQPWYEAAMRHVNDRMMLETAEKKLRDETRPGTPANTYAKLRVAGIRPRDPGVTLDSPNILNERDPALMPPRTDAASASSSHGQNWGAPPVPNRRATARMALKVMADHFNPAFDKTKVEKSNTEEWQEEVNKSKDALSDTTCTHYMSDHKSPAEEDRLRRQMNRAANEHNADRMFQDIAAKRSIAQTRPGTPAYTYAKVRVAGIKPLRKRTPNPSPPKPHSAAPHIPAGTSAPGMLAENAFQVVADHVQAGIPAAQTQRNQATEAFERSQRELDRAAKAWKKPFIEAMYHSQQQDLDINRRYRDNNRDQHRANQHLRILHETMGKLRDTGIGPRDMKRKRPGLEDAPNPNNTALNIVAQHFHTKLPEAKEQLLRNIKEARQTKTELDLQHEQHFDDTGSQPSWDLMDRHYGNIEESHQARKNLVHSKKTLNKLDRVGIRPRSPPDSGAGQGNLKPHPLAREALGIIAQHSQRRLDDALAKHTKAIAKVAETGARISRHYSANTLNTQEGLELLRQQRANNLHRANEQNKWLKLYPELYREDNSPGKTVARLRTSIKGVQNLHTHRKRHLTHHPDPQAENEGRS